MKNELLLNIENELLADWDEQLQAAVSNWQDAYTARKQHAKLLEQFQARGETDAWVTKSQAILAAHTSAMQIVATLLESKPVLVRLLELTDEEVQEAAKELGQPGATREELKQQVVAKLVAGVLRGY